MQHKAVKLPIIYYNERHATIKHIVHREIPKHFKHTTTVTKRVLSNVFIPQSLMYHFNYSHFPHHYIVSLFCLIKAPP